LANILAIDTSSAWCSVALSLDGCEPTFRHERVLAGASQLLLPWVEEMLAERNASLKDLSAIAVGIGPGAFTGVRLGVAVVQGLAISNQLPVISIASLDAIAAQVSHMDEFKKLMPMHFAIAIDARMDEVYWARYSVQEHGLPLRVGDIHLSKPETIDLSGIQFLAGSAIKEYGHRLPYSSEASLKAIVLDAEITVSALGILECAKQQYQAGLLQDVRSLEPLYIRNKVALTTSERLEAYK
jgi:tRNA threonylcarbamoyladenosine biosynthesis protein TsaB